MPDQIAKALQESKKYINNEVNIWLAWNGIASINN
jgi:hypothetical protein